MIVSTPTSDMVRPGHKRSYIVLGRDTTAWTTYGYAVKELKGDTLDLQQGDVIFTDENLTNGHKLITLFLVNPRGLEKMGDWYHRFEAERVGPAIAQALQKAKQYEVKQYENSKKAPKPKPSTRAKTKPKMAKAKKKVVERTVRGEILDAYKQGSVKAATVIKKAKIRGIGKVVKEKMEAGKIVCEDCNTRLVLRRRKKTKAKKK